MRIALLLTGCINPNGMSFTQLINVDERKEQYIHAIHYYLKETDCQVVFCENSNTDISPLLHTIENKQRFEILTYPGNNDKQKGKGFGEAEIVEYALHYSSVLANSEIVVKITGRLIINNIRSIVKSLTSKKDFVTCLFHSDLSFADSRIFCGTKAFYQAFLDNKNKINDSQGVFFEHILCSTILDSPIPYIPFSEEPLISGISGSTGETYIVQSPNAHRKLLYKHYSLVQLLKIAKVAKFWHISTFHHIIISSRIAIYKLLLTII